jgi:predicted nucleic acid-binding protein
MKNKGIIVDASVAINVAIGTDQALNKRIIATVREYDLISTSLFPYEVNNAIGKQYKSDYATRMDRLKRIMKIDVMPVDLQPKQMELAIKISAEVGDSIYDATYHALAILFDIDYYTCDERYYRRAKHFGNIQLLS